MILPLSLLMIAVVDETETDLRALIERDLGPLLPSTDFQLSVLDWLHFRARTIPQRRRAVIVSPEVQAKIEQYPAILKIKGELSQGKDVSPWLSDTVRKRVADPKADMMFNDWQIIHFHLGNLFVANDKIGRTGNLLFAFIAADHAVFLDVQPHGSWAMRGLLRILLKASPKDMRRCEAQGIVALANTRTDDEILQLRQAGLNVLIEVDGRFFMPGLGISTSKHSTRLVLTLQSIMRNISTMRLDLENNSLPQPLLQRIAGSIAISVRLGLKLEAGQVILYDKSRNLEFMRMPVLE